MILSILFATLAAATFEARSEHYSLSVENTAVSAKVVVTDLDSGSRVISEDVSWNPSEPSLIDRTIGDLHFKMRLVRRPALLTASLEVDRGDMEIDLIRSEWILQPHRLPPPPPPGVERVGGEVHAPQVVHRVEPVYPAEARMNKITGIVIVQTTIDATGKVVNVYPLQGPQELVAAAVDAVKQWTFEPATLKGKPVPVLFNLTVNFKLN